MPTVELILAQFGAHAILVNPARDTFTHYFPDARKVLYTDRDYGIEGFDEVRVVPAIEGNWRKFYHAHDKYMVDGLLSSKADVAISLDADLEAISDDVTCIVPLTQAFSFCIPACARYLVRVDMVEGTDGPGECTDPTRGTGYSTTMVPMAFLTSDGRAREMLELCRDNLTREVPIRGPSALWNACYAKRFAPYVLPPQWCVCGDDVGIGNEIVLHVGHKAVRTHYNAGSNRVGTCAPG